MHTKEGVTDVQAFHLAAPAAGGASAAWRLPVSARQWKSTPAFVIAPEPSSPLITLSFSESASYFKRVQGYEFRAEDGKYTAYFYMANEDEPYPVPVDQVWVDKLNGFIGQYGMMSWNGFHGSDSMLLDDTQFSISFSFADRTAVHAGGYGSFPENYGDASRAIDAHFLQLLPEDMRGW